MSYPCRLVLVLRFTTATSALVAVGCVGSQRPCTEAADCLAGEVCLTTDEGAVCVESSLAADDDVVDAGVRPEPGPRTLRGAIEVAAGEHRGANDRTLRGHVPGVAPTTSRGGPFTLVSRTLESRTH